MMDQEEIQAIQACQQGRLNEFSRLYERYVEKIYRFIYYKTGHRQICEDLTSLTFLKALEHVSDYKVDRGMFSSWLYRIAQNTVIDHYRTSKPQVSLDDLFQLSSQQDLSDDTEIKLALDEVKTYLASLEADVRDLLIMRLWQGLTYQEIADITGKSEGALKMAAARALKRLRASLPPLAFIIMGCLIYG
jgi:RNA polymerase sigma-70 factor, ECF subfamily